MVRRRAGALRGVALVAVDEGTRHALGQCISREDRRRLRVEHVAVELLAAVDLVADDEVRADIPLGRLVEAERADDGDNNRERDEREIYASGPLSLRERVRVRGVRFRKRRGY